MSEVIDIRDWNDKKAVEAARRAGQRTPAQTVMLIRNLLRKLDDEVKET